MSGHVVNLAGKPSANDQFLGFVPAPKYGEVAPDGDAYPFKGMPIGTLYVRKVDATHIQEWLKVKDDNNDQDWHVIRGVISQQAAYSAFTDGGAAAGTLTMTADLPAGAYVEGTQFYVNTAFTGTTPTITVGTVADPDRYNTGTPSLASAGFVSPGEPSGTKYSASAVTDLTITVAEAADFGLIDAGVVTVTLFYRL